MAEIRFSGLGTLPLSVSQGSVRNLTITATQIGVDAAPSPWQFDVTAMDAWPVLGPTDIHNPRLHELTYVWSFGDGSNSIPTTTLNTPDVWKDINEASAKQPKHVFNDAGSYTVTCYAFYQGSLWATGTTDLSVGTAAAAFPTTQTILFDPTGTGDEASYPSANIQTTFAGCIAARQALGASNARILLKRGETISDLSSLTRGFWGSGISNFRLGAWGSGDRPTLGPDESLADYIDIEDDADGVEIVLSDLDVRGGWDSTTETGFFNSVFQAIGTASFSSYMAITSHRCKFSGFTSVTNLQDQGLGTSIPSYITFNDCEITDWRDYGAYFNPMGGNSHIAFMGCSVHQHEDALSGGTKNFFYNTHGGVRISEAKNVFISVCDFFSRTGWSPLGSWTGNNPGLRLQTIGVEDTENHLDRVAVEGLIELARDASGAGTNYAYNCVVDKLLQVIGGTSYAPTIWVGSGGLTVRNAVLAMLDVPQFHTANPDNFFGFGIGGSDAVNAAAPINIHNVTMLDLRSDANSGGNPADDFGDFETFSNVTTENNVLHAPNRGTPVSGDGPIDVTTPIAGFTPRDKGVRYNFDYQTGTLSGDVAQNASFTVAYSAITEDLYKQTGAPATDQAYWQAIEGTDTLHQLKMNGANLRAEVGHFDVSFDASVVTITNRTGSTWSSGSEWFLKLDRKSLIPAMDTTHRSDNQTVPTGQLQAGSAALNDATTGKTASHDWNGDLRATPTNRGAY